VKIKTIRLFLNSSKIARKLVLDPKIAREAPIITLLNVFNCKPSWWIGQLLLFNALITVTAGVQSVRFVILVFALFNVFLNNDRK